MEKKYNLVLIFILTIMLLFAGCSSQIKPDTNNSGNDNSNLNLKDSSFEENDEVKVFNSKEELVTFLRNKQNSLENQMGGFGDIEDDTVRTLSDSSIGFSEQASASTKSVDSSASYSSDYSQTNVQVEGVDESDIVKTDGKYIYTLSQNKLIIVDVYPAENSKIVSEIEFENQETPINIFINDDKLIIFTNKREEVLRVSSYNFIPEQSYETKTHLYIYDIKNKEDIKEIKDFSVDGNFHDSRMIGNNVYLVSKKYQYFYNDIILPALYDSNVRIATPQIYYFDMPYYSQNFNTVTGLNLDTLEIDSKTFMLDSSDTLYVSENSIYISYAKHYAYDQIDVLTQVIMPLISQKYQNQIQEVLDNKYSKNVETEKITEILENMYNSMDEKDKKELIENIEEKSYEHYINFQSERSKTTVHKINIEDGKIDYDTKGEFKGHLLNQFSLDEKDSKLRVATTTSFYDRKNGMIRYNNVYVFDESLNLIGSLENLAQDERIYSTRFMGDKLYMVTFKEIDPLFVIDLSQDNPKVLGELKIPGYSDYLHPYDDTHLIGVGKDTKESEWGGVVNNGVKISLFDISDFNNPKEVDNYIIEGRFTDSLVSNDHKAFLFSAQKGLLVLPVREHFEVEEERDFYYNNNYANSAFVFDVNKEGFELRGKITHEENVKDDYYWYDSPSAIKRSLYLDDVLYTISQKKVFANDLEELDLIKEIDLGYKLDERKPIYYY